MSIDYKACANAIMMIGRKFDTFEEFETASDAIAELLRSIVPLTPERAKGRYEELMEEIKQYNKSQEKKHND